MQGSEESVPLAQAVARAMQKEEALAGVRDIYCKLQVEIDRRKPVCVASGKCCHFESYGHRLYVTTLELAAFKHDLQSSQQHRSAVAHTTKRAGGLTLQQALPVVNDGCPLQIGKLCGVHAIRPFGCRIFFCDPTATDWQQQQYELFHAQIKRLHQQFEVDYLYVEWRTALAELGGGSV